MTPTELVEYALIRVSNGESITAMIVALYGNTRTYRKQATPEDRARINKARLDYMDKRPEPKQKIPPRFFVETSAELKANVAAHCQENGISISRFIHTCIREGLRRSRQGS